MYYVKIAFNSFGETGLVTEYSRLPEDLSEHLRKVVSIEFLIKFPHIDMDFEESVRDDSEETDWKIEPRETVC